MSKSGHKSAGLIGGPTEMCADPNNPTFDPATHFGGTMQKAYWLCENAYDKMTSWEQEFIQSVYGMERLSKKQHITVYKIHKRLSE